MFAFKPENLFEIKIYNLNAWFNFIVFTVKQEKKQEICKILALKMLTHAKAYWSPVVPKRKQPWK